MSFGFKKEILFYNRILMIPHFLHNSFQQLKYLINIENPSSLLIIYYIG